MSRNRDRLGGPASTADAPAPAVMQDTNMGGFSFVTPTEFVELPSEGKHYAEGHPLYGETSIEIRQMTAKDEDLLTSRTLIKKGVVLDRLIQSLVVNKSINTDSLLVGDRNAIIIAARVSGYGNEYNVEVQCPACSETQAHTFDLNEAHITQGDIEKATELGVVPNKDGTYDALLPRSGVTVTFRLFTGQNEKELLSMFLDKRKNQDSKFITRQLSEMVVAVSGNDSSEVLDYFVNNVPSRDARHLRLIFKMVTPDIDLTQQFECAECDHTQQMEVPLTAEFFWPDG